MLQDQSVLHGEGWRNKGEERSGGGDSPGKGMWKRMKKYEDLQQQILLELQGVNKALRAFT